MTVLTRKAPPVRSPTLHSDVHGVHGAAGTTGWKGLFTRRDLASPTEAVEWAHLPAGAVSGEHRHTRTEEIYLILKGVGEYALNGEIHPIRAGGLALMTPGNTHGLRNTGDGPLDWWVIETLTPASQAVLAGREPSRSTEMIPRIADLLNTPRIETAGTFAGPLTAVERHLIPEGEVISIEAPGHETACFLNRGDAKLRFSNTEVPLSDPASFLVPVGAPATVAAQTESELFVVSLKVPTP